MSDEQAKRIKDKAKREAIYNMGYKIGMTKSESENIYIQFKNLSDQLYSYKNEQGGYSFSEEYVINKLAAIYDSGFQLVTNMDLSTIDALKERDNHWKRFCEINNLKYLQDKNMTQKTPTYEDIKKAIEKIDKKLADLIKEKESIQKKLDQL